MTTSSSSMPPTALSPNEGLIAILINNNNTLPTPNDHFRITIWSTQTKTLQSTLHYRGNDISSNVISQLQNKNNDDDSNKNNDNDNKSTYFIKLIFINQHSMAVAWNTKIVVWDIRRGVVAYQMNRSISLQEPSFIDIGVEKYDDVVASTNNTKNEVVVDQLYYYILTTKSINDPHKLIIHECQIATGKLHRIIKAGKLESSSSSTEETNSNIPNRKVQLMITNQHFIMFSLNLGLRVLNKMDGSKVCKVSESKIRTTLTKNNTTNTKQQPEEGELVTFTANESYATVLIDQNMIIIDILNGNIMTSDDVEQVTKLTKTNIQNLDLIQFIKVKSKHNNNNDNYWILVGNKVLYRLVINPSTKTYTMQQKIMIDMNTTNLHYSIPYLSSLFSMKMYMILCNSMEQIKIQSQSIPSTSFESDEDKESSLYIDWDDDNKKVDTTANVPTNDTKTTTIKKRKNDKDNEDDNDDENTKKLKNNTEESEVLEKKWKDLDDDDDDNDYDDETPTVGERLKWLQDALDVSDDDDDDDENKNQKEETELRSNNNKSLTTYKKNDKITTESLTILLQQAIQSNDHSTLELALSVNDMNIINQTLYNMNMNDIIILIVQITNRIASKPKRMEQLLKWIQSILSTVMMMSNNDDTNINIETILHPLRNLLLERVEVYPDLIQLQNKIQSIL